MEELRGRVRFDWTATVDGEEHPNVVWSYPTPPLDVAKIAGLMCFYNEKVDISIDGVRQERPAWSTRPGRVTPSS